MKSKHLLGALLALTLGLVGCKDEGGKGNPSHHGDDDKIKERTVQFVMTDYFSTDGEEFSSITDGVVTFEGNLGTNPNANSPKFYVSTNNHPAVRLYTQNEYSFTATKITKIVFQLYTGDSSKTGADMTIISGGGTYNASTRTWEGDEVNSVQFKVPTTQKQTWVESFTITYTGKGGTTPGEDDPSSEYTVLGVMKDLDMWAFPEEYDFSTDLIGPDVDGKIKCDYCLVFDEGVEDTDDCLIEVLNYCITQDSFPSYLEVDSTIYVDDGGYGNVFLATPDYAIAVYIYDFYYEGEVSVCFEAAPYDYYE